MRVTVLLALLVLLVACSDTSERLAGPNPDSGITATSAGSQQAPALQQVPAFQQGVVVVQFESGAPAADIAATQGASVARVLKQGIHVLRVPVGREQTVASALSRNPRVVFAELSVPRTLGLPCEAGDGDCAVPSDQLFGRRWDLHNNGAVRDEAGNVLESQGLVPDADMDWLEAYDLLGAFTEGALIGIVDTGIFPGHEDLSGKLLYQHDFFNIDPVAEDDHGHGTHASGIMLAHGNNGTGVSGVAYGANIRLAVAKGCGNTIIGYLCWSPDVADGIMWLADRGVAAINLSLGGESPSSAEQAALQYAVARNVLPICAAGNDEGAVDWPAAFPECMAVSSTRWDDNLASYSSFGPEVEVAAPGGEILHANGLDMILSTWLTGGYVYMAGTSMATPQVTGLAGLLHALGVTDADEKRALIRSTADDLGALGPDQYFGDGRINVWAAVQEAVGDPPPPPPDSDPPVASFTWVCTHLDCDFEDTSTDDFGVTSWNWAFGDGAISPVQHPSHHFPSGDTYTVTLTVTDAQGQSDIVWHEVPVSDPPIHENQPPVASFTFSCAGLTCQFTDTSTDDKGVIAWLWYPGFGGETNLYLDQNPLITFPASGLYSVELVVEDADGGLGAAAQDVEVTEATIHVHVADIVAERVRSGRNTAGSADVTIQGPAGIPIEGATVMGEWLVNETVQPPPVSGVTGPDGVAAGIVSDPLPLKTKDVLTFCVTGVAGSNLVYEETANSKTCAVAAVSEDPTPPAGFTLTTTVKRNGDVTLKWEGSTATLFDIWKDGVKVAEDDASPHLDRKPGPGTYLYKVCEAGTNTCTNDSEAIVQ
jgi:subtilisin family serine protease